MAYKNLGTFLTKVTLKAIAKLDEADVDECMRIAENVMAWANAGTITSEQLDELLAALPVDVAEAKPEPAETPQEVEAEPEPVQTEEQPAEETSAPYDGMTKAELLALCEQRGIEAYESWTKAEIITALEA